MKNHTFERDGKMGYEKWMYVIQLLKKGWKIKKKILYFQINIKKKGKEE